MFYSSSAVSDILKCAFCAEKFVYAVKMIPECGYSICGRCYEDLKDHMLKSSEYECRACSQWHAMSTNGLADNQALIKMLQLRPETRALPRKAEELRALIGETRGQLERVNAISGVDEVLSHCRRLKEAVAESLEEKAAQLRREAEERLREIADLEGDLVSALSEEPSTSSRTAAKRQRLSAVESLGSGAQEPSTGSELAELTDNLDSFSAEWDVYFTRLSKAVTDADLDRAQAEIGRLAARIRELEAKVKKEAFGGRYAEWRDNEAFLMQRNLLGELVSEAAESQSPPRLADETGDDLIDPASVGASSSDDTTALTSEPSAPPAAVSDRLVFSVTAHSKCIYDAVFLPDSGNVASCSMDQTIKVWHRDDGRCLFDLKIPDTAAVCLAALPNGWLAAGCIDASIRIWDLSTRERVRIYRSHKNAVFMLRTLTRSSGGGYLASVSWDNTIKIWNPYVEKGARQATMTGHDCMGDGIELCELPDGRLITCSNDKHYKHNSIIRVWDASTGALVASVPTKAKGAASLCVLAGERAAVGFRDGRVRVFDLVEQRELQTLGKCHSARILGLVALPNNQLASCGSRKDPTIKIWDLETGGLVESITTGHRSDIWSLSLSPDGRRLASASGDHDVKLWSLLS